MRCECWGLVQCPRLAVEVAVFCNPNINCGDLAMCEPHLRRYTDTMFDHIGGAA